MKLYYSPNLNPRVAVAVAKYLGSPVEFVRASPMDPRYREQFRPINPNTRVPILVEEGRAPLWETDAIAFRLSALAGGDFWPTDERMVEILRWVSWSTHHFTRAADVFYFLNLIRPQFLSRPENQKALEEAADDLRVFGPVLDEVLAGRTWLVGDHPTYADFRVATALPFAERAGIPVTHHANIMRWHDRLNRIDAWRDPFAGLEA
ncbi:glutathione S-transferase family protein [Inquilinus limosus]|uniref:glutathione S-transferase family protein n=1 Tax=Inquilinus limosus TaxID=171674 RepID=UPI003F13D4BF